MSWADDDARIRRLRAEADDTAARARGAERHHRDQYDARMVADIRAAQRANGNPKYGEKRVRDYLKRNGY